MFALYIFTNTRVAIKKYLLLSSILTVITYFTRWFPINLGTHTMLTLLLLIVIHLTANKGSLHYIIKTIVSVIVIALIILVSETIDMLLLAQIYGNKEANEMLTSSDAVIKSLSALPSIVIFGLVVLIIYIVLEKKRNKKDNDGKAGKKNSA
jgi:hypothetical protein